MNTTEEKLCRILHELQRLNYNIQLITNKLEEQNLPKKSVDVKIYEAKIKQNDETETETK